MEPLKDLLEPYVMPERSSVQYYTPEILEVMKKTLGPEEYPDKSDYQCATHIASTVNRFTRNHVIEDCVKILANFEYDTLAFQGASGIGISLILAHLLQKEVILVRKIGEPRQAYVRYASEGYRQAKRYIVVDDLISTGMTVARVIKGVRDLAPQAELAGILLYYEGVQVITADSGGYSWKRTQELSNDPKLNGITEVKS